MCGLIGFAQQDSFCAETAGFIATKMAATIIHRGPNDFGVCLDADAGILLAHRRLSILDVSDAGHQPMLSASGRYAIVFNGEIYNHLELRNILEKFGGASQWRGHSDTETILSCFEKFGVERTIQKAVGAFAIGVWDRTEKSLILARDRLGEKPLYYGWNGGMFFFASELKALRVHPNFAPEINRHALSLFFRYNCIPTPYSIYRGIYKLWPGSILMLKKGAENFCPWELDAPPLESFHSAGVSLLRYWSLSNVAKMGQSAPFSGSENEASDELEKRLTEAVISQQLSDVPLGALLSGGVDSSTIVALMQANALKPVKTFTIGFTDHGYNEALYAKAVAARLGTDHTELYVAPKDALAVIPSLPELYDEPFSDSSQIPTSLVAKMARQHVTVALSGDAGDEFFGGYNRYLWTNLIWKKIRWIPMFIRCALSWGIKEISPSFLNHLSAFLVEAVPERLRVANAGEKVYKLAEIITAASREAIYHQLVSHWKDPMQIVIGGLEPSCLTFEDMTGDQFPEFEHRMMYYDAINYLPDDILVKVDRASMAVSLETRSPFLDYRVVEFAWQLPLSMKIRNGQGKWILRQVLQKYVPRELVGRPKMGFGIPLDSWLRGPLRDWAESLLDEDRLKREGFLNPEPIRRKWQEHVSGRRNWQYLIWDVLMFQAWHERWV